MLDILFFSGWIMMWNKAAFSLEVLIYKCLQILRHRPQWISNLYIFRIYHSLKMIGKGFLQKVSKKQFRTVYYNANACG